MDFDLGGLSEPFEFFNHTATDKLLRDMIPHLVGSVVSRRTVPDTSKIIRARSELGKWFKGRSYTLSVRAEPRPSGGHIGTRFSIWLELPGNDDAMYFKLRWGGR